MLKRWLVRYTLVYLTLLCLLGISQVPVLAKIRFEEKISTVYKGETRQLKVRSVKGEVEWKSTDPGILSVDGDGYVTGKKRGTAKISATCGDETAWMKIKVEWYTVKLAIPYPEKDWHEYQVEWHINQLPAVEAVTVWSLKDFDVDDFDGVILPGGGDLDPALYGEPNINSYGIDTAVDSFQMEVLDAFVKAGKPVLGLCRGCQLLNVYFGGTLRQHIGYMHYNTVWREIDVKDGTAFSSYAKNNSVRESHHQAVG
ncbi:MAG: gamma-glutamyl-gamma-aminobutyrate hydrolase family protein, partial [Lachnospiraceae bacterium]|nr:gamma-glutamyl-gamma-aminobutyrate hydrolase family protein [Lachnospiraceae bacterium]